MRQDYRIQLILMFMLAWLCSPAIAHEKEVVRKVPVFYVTDREPKGDAFGSRRLPEKDTVSGLQSGIVDVCVSGTEKQTPWQKEGLALSTCSKVQPAKIKPFKGRTSEDLSGEFDSAFLAAVEKSPRKEAFIFVHGFNNDFETAAHSAAQLSVSTGSPVILYSWPSAGKLYRYSLDECNNEWSQEHFNQFLEHINEIRQAHQLKFSFVAHSMGNRLFVRASPVFSGKGIFTDIYMVNPDFDAQTFIHYMSRYIPKTGVVEGCRGELLVSRRDKALSAAEGLFGGYTRLGQGADFTLSALTSPDLFKKLWATKPAGKPVSEESVPNQERVSSIKRALKITDVTVFDHGFIGHTIPDQYIAWMHNRNTPPEGFECNPDLNKRCNRLSTFFAKMCGLKIEEPEGESFIVTKTAVKPGKRQSLTASK